ncbi:MAG: hypothetical protein K9I71_02415 [Ignavibacteriales bacterium]|nr:hypothetical protein [Ignavibacteriales bacterium]MCF8314944.1 hypothetical protein [Ignavibacteriales bacterium]MCF8436107.1 hypothetical protein [Ignavibacteriales bacterium]
MERVSGELANGLIDALKEILPESEISNFKDYFKSLEKSSVPLSSKNIITANGISVESNAAVHRFITYIMLRYEDKTRISILIAIGNYCIARGQYNIAADIFAVIINKFKNNPNFRLTLAYCYMETGNILACQASWKRSVTSLKTSVSLFNELNDFKGLAKSNNIIGSVYAEKGELDSAFNYFNSALGYAGKINETGVIAGIEANIGILNNMRGKFDAAYGYFNRALIRFTELNELRYMAEMRHNLGMYFLEKELFESAFHEFDESINLSVNERFMPVLALGYISKAYTYTILSDLKLAKAFNDIAAKLGYELSDKLTVAESFKIEGIINRKSGNHALGESNLQTAIRLNQELGNQINLAESQIELALLFLDLNDYNSAATLLSKAAGYYRRIGNQKQLDKIKSLKEQIRKNRSIK